MNELLVLQAHGANLFERDVRNRGADDRKEICNAVVILDGSWRVVVVTDRSHVSLGNPVLPEQRPRSCSYSLESGQRSDPKNNDSCTSAVKAYAVRLIKKNGAGGWCKNFASLIAKHPAGLSALNG